LKDGQHLLAVFYLAHQILFPPGKITAKGGTEFDSRFCRDLSFLHRSGT
jgi:hypothetical protein